MEPKWIPYLLNTYNVRFVPYLHYTFLILFYFVTFKIIND